MNFLRSSVGWGVANATNEFLLPIIKAQLFGRDED
jgi:hypothetical protein